MFGANCRPSLKDEADNEADRFTRGTWARVYLQLCPSLEIARRSIIWVHTVLSVKPLNFHPTIILTETLLVEKERERGGGWSSLKISQDHRSQTRINQIKSFVHHEWNILVSLLFIRVFIAISEGIMFFNRKGRNDCLNVKKLDDSVFTIFLLK